jgi:hypothetical protein
LLDFDLEAEARLANSLLKRCIENVQKPNSEVEKALRSPGVLAAISKLESVVRESPELLYLNIFRLGATVALSIRDAEAIK